MMGKIIQALTTAYKRDHEGVENVVVDVDEEKQDLKMYVQKDDGGGGGEPRQPDLRWRRPRPSPPSTSWAAW